MSEIKQLNEAEREELQGLIQAAINAPQQRVAPGLPTLHQSAMDIVLAYCEELLERRGYVPYKTHDLDFNTLKIIELREDD